MSPHPSPPKPLSENTSASRFPLIRDILKSYSPSTDSSSSSWLSDPAVMDAVRKTMPIGYTSQDITLLDPKGQLMVWGVRKSSWKHCLCIGGLQWTTLKSDLADLFDGHDIVDPPIILGNEENFITLVYMRSLKDCRNAIADLDGAEVARETVLRVALATKADLKKALIIQEQV